MFQPQMKTYRLYKPDVVVNELNEKVITYTYSKDVEIAVTANTSSEYQVNDTNVFNVVYAGLTKYRCISRGDKVDNMIVEHVEEHRLYNIIYMKEVANDGKI